MVELEDNIGGKVHFKSLYTVLYNQILLLTNWRYNGDTIPLKTNWVRISDLKHEFVKKYEDTMIKFNFF